MYDECSDEITKIEALKINFLISMNKDSIENAFVEGYKYSDEDFILKNYAYTNNFKKVITKSNKDEKITVADELYALYLIEKGRYNDVETSEKITLENINNYEEEKKIAIQTMYDKGIVEKEDFDINEYYKKINNCSFMTQKEVEEYVEYVKQNKVKIEGNGYANIPMIYSDGTYYYYIRTYVNFKITESNINSNKLMQNIKFLDNDLIEFEKGTLTIKNSEDYKKIRGTVVFYDTDNRAADDFN